MVGMSRPTKVMLAVLAVLCALGAPALILVVVLVDLSTADQVASVAGAAASLVALSVTLIALRPSDPGTVRALGDGSVSVGGNITQSPVGARSRSKVKGPI